MKESLGTQDVLMKGRQIAFMIFEHFKINETDKGIYTLQSLLDVQ